MNKVFLVYVEYFGDKNVQTMKPVKVTRTLQSAEAFRAMKTDNLATLQILVDAGCKLTNAWASQNEEPADREAWAAWDAAESAYRNNVWETLKIRAVDLPCPREYLDSAEYMITEVEADDSLCNPSDN